MNRNKVFLVLLIAFVVAAVALLMVPKGSTSEPELSGTVLTGKPVPDLVLKDQFGHRVTLRQFRGHPLLITFMEAHCREACPVVAEKIHRTLATLGRSGTGIGVVAISTDPERDTLPAVKEFSRKHGMLHRWHYLRGTRKTLAAVWRAYYVYAAPRNAPPSLKDAHTSVTYIIDQAGRERVLFGADLNTIALERDLRILSGLSIDGTRKAAVSSPEVGHSAPDFVLTDTRGSHLAASSMQGKVVLVNFWATYCIPCRAEMPLLMRWYKHLRARGFSIIGVDKEEPRADVVAFLHKLHIGYPVLLDENGTAFGMYNISFIPTSFIVDRLGIIRSVHIGIIDDSYLKEHVLKLL